MSAASIVVASKSVFIVDENNCFSNSKLTFVRERNPKGGRSCNVLLKVWIVQNVDIRNMFVGQTRAATKIIIFLSEKICTYQSFMGGKLNEMDWRTQVCLKNGHHFFDKRIGRRFQHKKARCARWKLFCTRWQSKQWNRVLHNTRLRKEKKQQRHAMEF